MQLIVSLLMQDFTAVSLLIITVTADWQASEFDVSNRSGGLFCHGGTAEQAEWQWSIHIRRLFCRVTVATGVAKFTSIP